MPFDGISFNASSMIVDLMIERLADPSNWTKGRMREYEPGKHDRLCMIGALKHVMTEISLRDPRLARTVKYTLAGVIKDSMNTDDYSLARRLSRVFPAALIMQFNDDPFVSHGDIMTVLRTTQQRLL